MIRTRKRGKGNALLSQSKWDLSSLSADSSEDGCKTRGPGDRGAGGRKGCRECGRSFPSSSELALHLREHQPEMTCNMCRVVFRRVPSLRLHLSNAHRDASLRCRCGQAFATVWDFNLHLATHYSRRELCHMPCPTYAKLGQHRLMHAARPPGYQPERLVGRAMETATPPTTQAGSPSRPIEEPEAAPETPSTQREGWGGHAYVDNGKRKNFAVVVRSINSVTLRFPRDSVAEENRDKKIHVVVVRNVTGKKTEGIKQEEGEGDREGRRAQVQGYRAIENPAEEEEEDVKPDVSSLMPLLPAAPSRPALLLQDNLKAEEGSCLPVLPDPALGDSETESIAESNPVLPESTSDSDSLPEGDSEFNPGEISDASSDSFSSGNSSGSSYRPGKRRGSSCVGGGAGGNQPRWFQKPQRPIQPNPSSTAAPPAADVASASRTASTYKCPHCGIAYSSPSLMQRHAQSCPERPVAVACELCSLTFPSQNSLIQHKAQAHHCVRMYACHLCREVFPDFVIFSRHACPSLDSPSAPRQRPTSTPVPSVVHDARASPAVVLGSPPPPPPPPPQTTTPQVLLQPPAPEPNVATDAHPISQTLLTTSIASSSPSPNPNPNPAPDPEPLKILGLYVNLSKESTPEGGPLAPSTPAPRCCLPRGVLFECRQCGASSHQPSLPVRHRYLHRGPRAHRCQCGKAFTRSLHLLRHQVRHAESSRYICGPCGATFTGATRLAQHKKRKRRRRRRKRKGARRRACQDPFRCICGLPFKKPAAYLWHKLKNRKYGAKNPCRQPSLALSVI
ncbi:zinc finger protein 628 [Polyodon spathula]|uniref:zinc finger protein 628 n=1 Tax=Polyodon spathula TaxID=7913 RepID=UPI001B7EBDBF|nr:zinc finger protein 628 [Polyodon spathula]